MWLDDLDQLVQTLADRIKQHRHILNGNEQATRYALIDPLLAGLGWNLADPSEVVAEYRLGDSGERRVDYAMLHNDRPYLLIEAKNLGERLSKAAEQAGQYALTTEARFVVLTNGQQWEGYSLGGLGNKHVFQFKVAGDSHVLDLLWLWHGNFKGHTTQPNLRERASDAEEFANAAPSTPSPERAPGGVPLPDVNYTKEQPNPRRLVFPGGEEKDVSKWANILPATAEWLIDHNHVRDLPLRNQQGTHLMHEKPTKKNGSTFSRPREVRKGHWVDMDLTTPQNLRRATELLLSCGVEPKEVRLELD